MLDFDRTAVPVVAGRGPAALVLLLLGDLAVLGHLSEWAARRVLLDGLLVCALKGARHPALALLAGDLLDLALAQELGVLD